MVKCETCGNDMIFCKTMEVDWNIQDLEMHIMEKWECLECGKMEEITIVGNITGIDRSGE